LRTLYTLFIFGRRHRIHVVYGLIHGKTLPTPALRFALILDIRPLAAAIPRRLPQFCSASCVL